MEEENSKLHLPSYIIPILHSYQNPTHNSTHTPPKNSIHF